MVQPVAAALAEMFPPAIRYSSLSIPYHLGTGYFGGFLPFISQYIVAKTGDPFAGLWYTWAITLLALIVCLVWLRDDARTSENLKYLNQYVLIGAKRAVENKWRGQAEYLGEVVKGTLTLVDGDTMTINGCKGALCQKFELTRL